MSNLVVSNISDGTTSVGTGYVVNGSAKAWVNFDGTSTIFIRDSHNVSGLVDNGAGSYTINFSNSFSATTYSNALTARGIAATIGSCGTENHDVGRNTGSLSVYSLRVDNGSVIDTLSFNAQIQGDLA